MRFSGLGVCGLVLMLGCSLFSGSGEVEGVVYLNGEPTGGFEVALTPAQNLDSGIAYYATAGQGGKYRVSQGKGNFSIPAGTYRVTFATVPVDDSVSVLELNLPAEYTDPQVAEHSIVVARGKNQFDFKLEVESYQPAKQKAVLESTKQKTISE